MKFEKTMKALLLLSICGLVLGLQTGCKKKLAAIDVYNSNIKKAYLCYHVYMDGNGYRGPKDEQEFKSYLTSNPTAIHILKRVNLDSSNLDETFKSERDGEPFVFRYGVQGPADHAIVFEKTGVDGKRLVALATPIELDAATYDGYLSGKTKAAAPAVDSSGK